MAKINVVAELLERHSDPEIIEYLYREMQTINRGYDAVIVDGLDVNFLLSQTEAVDLVTDILKALYKRDQARLAQSQE